MAGGRKPSFAVQALPFMAMMALGSWGLSQFLKLPTQVKDDRMRRKRHGLAKFDLEKEHEALQVQLQAQADNYVNVRVPGPRDVNRKPAD